MVDVSAQQLLLLCVAALVAGLVDAIAGGGGLITLPALLTVGLPPHVALGTNKGQSVFGSFAALVRFSRSGLVDWRLARVTFPFGLGGAFAGAALVLLVKPEVLKPLVLVLLIAVAVFLAFRRTPASGARTEPSPRPRALAIGGLIALAVGTYDGFFGPGTGTFLIVGFNTLLGHGLARASADAKVVNFASNLASMALFALNGVVLWKVALPMAAAQFTGAWLGAHLAVKGGDTLVRKVVLAVVLALVLKLGRDVVMG
ncbi:TSUP family transporter [Myxococcus llanfairpwllgwyngyllgogerychwyrndrobwllllantysiliogogogochensis]|uniref:Probable membrane transporter protein n=1 Tax=Myxococcus llanfairpwllgwyngyllgogerychwyrndrobwllllantysiliogogogochensis TaxID=2590453 RepID=A0A540X1M8_9BACT|nr:TSUP family transporter [Myxococcus llanfairpwllgwyngyllgogerychwyrndrobwllllantysiliogogogochensis]TQF15177.1 TSUP family transporter [Myxococcus llanfairpwllgwyngyllgogerychwyrndrobwllllantysiliogogogochensis]